MDVREVMEQCSICGGYCELTGVLGTLCWHTCTACGMLFYIRLTDEELEEYLYEYDDELEE